MTAQVQEEIVVGPIAVRFLVESGESDGSVAVFEFGVPAGLDGPASHSHDAYEETVYGLRGVLTWTIDGSSVDVGPGEVVCIRRGVVHRFDNNGDVDAVGLAVVTPGVLGPDYFRELAAVIDAATAGPPDPAELAAVMRRHGLTPASR
jgi:quercetin dioxygenase-like cupin family protein